MIALFVPGDRPERFEKAAASGADAVILDLEDAVAPDRKAFARNAVFAAVRRGLQAWVRVNRAASDDGTSDLTMLAEASPAAVMLPKVGRREELDRARERLPGIALTALIESIDGVRRIDEIAGAAGVTAIALGGYDLCAELRARPTPDVLAPWRSHVVFAARAAGIDAFDTPFANLDDAAGLAADAERAVDFGFDGKLAIHPKQIPIIRAAFEPDATEIEHARAVVAAAAGGAVRVGETMVDAPLVAAARRVLARARP